MNNCTQTKFRLSRACSQVTLETEISGFEMHLTQIIVHETWTMGITAWFISFRRETMNNNLVSLRLPVIGLPRHKEKKPFLVRPKADNQEQCAL